MSSASDYFVLVPHGLHVLDSGATVPDSDDANILFLPSQGNARLTTEPQSDITPPGEPICVVTAQRFTGLSLDATARRLWDENPHGRFILSMPTAQWLTTT